METKSYTVTGTLTDEKTVTLDESLPISARKVRVTIEPLQEKRARPLDEVLAEIHAELRAAGHQPPTSQEVADYIRQERESWDSQHEDFSR